MKLVIDTDNEKEFSESKDTIANKKKVLEIHNDICVLYIQ